MTTDAETLALVLFTSRHRSRRQAKRLLREAGGAGTAAELDSALTLIAAHPEREAIESHVRDLVAAAMDASMAEATPPDIGGNHPEWLQCEDTRSDRTFLAYFGTDTAFIAEVFDDPADCGETAVVVMLDEGQALGNVLWLDEPPEPERQAVLWAQARRELRVYDQRIGL